MAQMPSVVGRYQVLEELGKGGFATVYRAHDPALERDVALKVLHQHLAGDAATRERFVREGRSLARVDHPNVVTVYEAGEAGDTAFMAMRLIKGRSLADMVIEHGPLSVPDLVRIIDQIAGALTAVHAQNLVHRDIKPANIMIEEGTGRAMLLDLGVARDMLNATMTSGWIVGTPGYMAPEQVRAGGQVTQQTDVYQLGATAYALLSGRAPHDGDTIQVLDAISRLEPAPLRGLRPDVSEPVAAAISLAMSKNPETRFKGATPFANALRAGAGLPSLPAAAPPPRTASPTGPLPPPDVTLLAPSTPSGPAGYPAARPSPSAGMPSFQSGPPQGAPAFPPPQRNTAGQPGYPPAPGMTGPQSYPGGPGAYSPAPGVPLPGGYPPASGASAPSGYATGYPIARPPQDAVSPAPGIPAGQGYPPHAGMIDQGQTGPLPLAGISQGQPGQMPPGGIGYPTPGQGYPPPSGAYVQSGPGGQPRPAVKGRGGKIALWIGLGAVGMFALLVVIGALVGSDSSDEQAADISPVATVSAGQSGVIPISTTVSAAATRTPTAGPSRTAAPSATVAATGTARAGRKAPQDLLQTLATATFSDSELPKDIKSKSIERESAGDDVDKRFNIVGQVTVELEGGPLLSGNVILYSVFPSDRDAKGRFDAGFESDKTSTVTGTFSPSAQAGPSKGYTATLASQTFGTSICSVLMDNVIVYGINVNLADAKKGDNDLACAVAKAGTSHLVKVR